MLWGSKTVLAVLAVAVALPAGTSGAGPYDPPPVGDVPRSISLSFAKNPRLLTGTLNAAVPACVAGETVQVMRGRDGDDVVVGSVVLTETGAFQHEIRKRRRGRYYAVVLPRAVAGGTCLAAKSPTILVKRKKRRG